ncbi:hypothetical protein CTheo_4892 [Ceratobasidium theobromae]|uniref:Peptidase C14 caspase domain-containing protein n=1 Tax=Ceratobasidium theobromae TaxID=1582974 RepID=A0A5N5QJ68_9AGAM|nr:hypothetical protein CTheo_4892 [Ceratobasidium theobromae]
MLARYRGDTSEKLTSGICRSDSGNEKIRLFALVIGINNYQTQRKLKGAVSDADAFATYLLQDLQVPEGRIMNLRDDRATRVEIIKAFKSLQTNTTIQYNDAIVIYYAGHGASIPAPVGWEAGKANIEALVPQDVGLDDSCGSSIPPIPDRTVSALLSDLARSKGDNITVIFDCCHSASGTRQDEDVPGRLARLADFTHFPPLPCLLDQDIIGTDARAPTVPKGFSHREMRSHVLLAACGSEERAYETNGHGDYTTALLAVLRTFGVDRLTYKGCMERLPSLPRQNPHCEGHHVGRIFFNAKSLGASRSFISIEPGSGDQYILKAGVAQGITVGSIFDVYESHIFSIDNTPLGKLRVHSTELFTAILVRLDNQTSPSFDIPTPAYACQSGCGVGQELNIYFTDRFIEAARSDDGWNAAFNGNENEVAFRPVETVDLAQFIVDINEDGNATYTTRHSLSNVNGITLLPYTSPKRAGDVLPVLRSAARWHWHVDRTNPDRPLNGAVHIEFYRVAEDYTDCDSEDNPIIKPTSPNLNLTGIVEIVDNPDAMYGVKLVNNSYRDLYPYLFYFDVNGLAIGEPVECILESFHNGVVVPESYYVGSTIGKSHIEAPLRAKSTFTIGYGSGGEVPFGYELLDDRKVDIGILKLFVTTLPTEFDSLEQQSPFGDARKLVRQPDANQKLKSRELWDTSEMILVQRGSPQQIHTGI